MTAAITMKSNVIPPKIKNDLFNMRCWTERSGSGTLPSSTLRGIHTMLRCSGGSLLISRIVRMKCHAIPDTVTTPKTNIAALLIGLKSRKSTSTPYTHSSPQNLAWKFTK